MTDTPAKHKGPHIIVVGNEKGGVGKTTTAIHIMLSLLYDGYKVGSIDLDSRQRSMSHFLENRRNHIVATRVPLPFPSHFIINRSRLDSQEESKSDETHRFVECLEKASANNDYIVIDSPGTDTFMSRLAHSYAHTVVTPINDSFLDLDVLARVNSDNLRVDRHGIYSEMIWEAKIHHARRNKGEIDWVVLRNRLTNIDAVNKRRMSEALENLSRRVGCRVAKGLGERVIYRELFLKGLSLLDVMSEGSGIDVKISHVAARQELRELMDFLNVRPASADKDAAPAAAASAVKPSSVSATPEMVTSATPAEATAPQEQASPATTTVPAEAANPSAYTPPPPPAPANSPASADPALATNGDSSVAAA